MNLSVGTVGTFAKCSHNSMSVKSLLIPVLLSIVANSHGEKSWMFAISGNRRPSDFIDTDGYVKGAVLDLINSVCKIASKKCEITVQPFEDCSRTVREKVFPGVGIMSQWYDACVGYVNTPERLNSMAFTDPYAKSQTTFAVALGNPRNFDPRNVSNSVITYLNGAYTGSQCLQRLNLVPGKIIVAKDIYEAKALIQNGTADALFSFRTNIPGLLVLSERYDCSGGVGMMVRKDSLLPGWWNPAFQQFYRMGQYTHWCNTRGQKYGGYASASEYCLPPPTSAGTSSGLGR